MVSYEVIGQKAGRRLVAQVKDKTGFLELTWFQGVSWIQKSLQQGQSYLIYGRVGFFNGKPQIVHPELEILSSGKPEGKSFLEPVYPTTEKLKARGMGGRQLGKLTQVLLNMLHEKDIPENLPGSIIQSLKLANRYSSYRNIHFPQNSEAYEVAVTRLKFEELFMAQLRMAMLRSTRHRFQKELYLIKWAIFSILFIRNIFRLISLMHKKESLKK